MGRNDKPEQKPDTKSRKTEAKVQRAEAKVAKVDDKLGKGKITYAKAVREGNKALDELAAACPHTKRDGEGYCIRCAT